MPQKTENIVVKIIGKDQFSKVFGNAEKKMGGFRKKLNDIGAVGLAAGSAIAVGIGVKAVGAAAEFETGMTNVATLLDTTTENMEVMGKEIKDMAKRVPVDLASLTSSLYDVRSAGIDAGSAMKVLEDSAKLGVAGLGTTKEAADLLTTAINAFGLQGRDSSEVADILFKTVKAGKTDISRLSQAFGKMAGNAKAANISFEDAQAATAALTALTGKTSEAQNALAQVFLELTVQGGKLDKGLTANGASLDMLNVKIGEKGLVGGMKEMQEEMGLTETEFKNLFSSAEGGTSVFQLLTDAYDANNTASENMKEGQIELEKAYDKQTDTAKAQYDLLKNNLNVAFADLGNIILPSLVEALKLLPHWLEEIGSWWDSWIDSLSKVFTAIDKVQGASDKMADSVWAAGGKVGEFFSVDTAIGVEKKAGEFFSKEWEFITSKLPKFADGGTVPGPSGKPMHAIVHGGETITPVNKTAGNTFNFNFSGAFIGNVGEFKKQLMDSINRESELKTLGGI